MEVVEARGGDGSERLKIKRRPVRRGSRRPMMVGPSMAKY